MSAAQAYADFFARLSPGALAHLHEVFEPDVHFRDPFNDVHGISAVRRVFEDMYEKVQEPRFEVLEVVENDDVAYLSWRFHYRLPRIGDQSFEGVSRCVLSANGKVREHVDYWDPSVPIYEKIPLLSSMLRLVKKRLSA